MKKTYVIIMLAALSVIACAASVTPDSAKAVPAGANATTPGTTPSSTPSAVQNKIVKLEVMDVYNREHADKNDLDHSKAGLGDEIVIHVKGISDLLNRAAAQHKDIKLFLDNRQIDDIKPVSGAPDNDEQDFQFILQRTAANDKVWSGLLGKPAWGSFFLRPTKVSVGLDGAVAEMSNITGFQLVRVRHVWFVSCLIGLAAYLVALISLTIKSPILRDNMPDLTAIGMTVAPGIKAPYSLGKVQMAFWFSLMLGAFLFIWLITGNYDIITPGVLGLIGISATTALGAVTIGDSKNQSAINEIKVLQQQKSALQATTPPPADPQQQLQKLDDTIFFKRRSLQLGSNGFLDDILTDENGVAFHRLQMFVWMLVLGILFIYSAWTSLIMPDFSTTLLTLQGITAGTYLGFKFPEKQT